MKTKGSEDSLAESMQSDMSTMEWADTTDSLASTPDTPHQPDEKAQVHTYYSHTDIIDADVWDELLDVLKVTLTLSLSHGPLLSLSLCMETGPMT